MYGRILWSITPASTSHRRSARRALLFLCCLSLFTPAAKAGWLETLRDYFWPTTKSRPMVKTGPVVAAGSVG